MVGLSNPNPNWAFILTLAQPLTLTMTLANFE